MWSREGMVANSTKKRVMSTRCGGGGYIMMVEVTSVSKNSWCDQISGRQLTPASSCSYALRLSARTLYARR